MWGTSFSMISTSGDATVNHTIGAARRKTPACLLTLFFFPARKFVKEAAGTHKPLMTIPVCVGKRMSIQPIFIEGKI
jgi:hypothetical protein